MSDHITDPSHAEDRTSAVSQHEISRRGVLTASAAAAALATAGITPGTAEARPSTPHTGTQVDPDQLSWLIGDHHVHTQYSHDAKYKIAQQLDNAEKYGIKWIVFTEYSNVGHRKQGVYDQYDELEYQRARRRKMLIFQGIEWYIPSAEHCTVFTAPGKNSVETLRAFLKTFDGRLNGWEKGAPYGSEQAAQWEQKAVDAVEWLDQQRKDGVIDDALVIANHPMRLGVDSPHELRNMRDAAPDLVIGMEGAPGTQAYGAGLYVDPGDQRGEYVAKPKPECFPGYLPDMYRPYGGFDWMTATVGGLWDSMLAEGKPFFITANSDNHLTAFDTWKFDESKYPTVEPWASATKELDKFNVIGRRPDPVQTNEPQRGSDYWPGQFSRNHVGATSRSYAAVMEGLRAGRNWVDHGHLLQGFDVRVRALQPGKGKGRGKGNGNGWGQQRPVTLGGHLAVKRGQDVEITMTVTTTDYENFAGFRPDLHHVDIIGGPITGPVADRETLRAPLTKVITSFDTAGRLGTYTLRYVLHDVTESCYVRFRGSDGKRNGVGYYGADVDPKGPIRHGDNVGDANPWIDTWFYANPVFIDVI